MTRELREVGHAKAVKTVTSEEIQAAAVTLYAIVRDYQDARKAGDEKTRLATRRRLTKFMNGFTAEDHIKVCAVVTEWVDRDIREGR